MGIEIIPDNRLTGKNNMVNKSLEKRVAELCKSLERGGEKITDSAVALRKKSILRH